MFVLHFSTKSDASTLSDARHRVRDAVKTAGLHGRPLAEMDLAVGEVLTNTHRHAYPGGVGPVSVAVLRNSETVCVLIIDKGRATEPPEVPRKVPELPYKDGLGLYLARFFVDQMRVDLSKFGHGLRVRLAKRLTPTVAAIGGG